MATGDMFLMVEGEKSGVVKGESNDSVYPGQIDITGWSWGMTTSSTIGGSGGKGRSALSELRVRKLTDTASTALMSVMRNNELIKKAVLTVRKAGGVQIDYLCVTVRNGRITNFEIAAPNGPQLSEELSIAFETIDVEYHEQDHKGGRKGGSMFSATAREP